MQDIRREIPVYVDPIYRPLPKPTEIPSQVMPRKFWTQTLYALGKDINIDFKENSPYQENVISETYQRPDKSGKLMQMFF